jgi:hypothetical protein
MFEIIKNKPLPAFGGKGGRPRIYPFEEMSVGDCFKIGDTYDEAEKVRGAAKSFAKNRGQAVKFGVRKQGCEWFIWRIK